MISNPLELEVQYANFRQAQMMADPVFIAVGAQRTSLTHFGDFCRYPIRILQQNNVLMQTYIYILQEEQSLCFLKSLQNIHLGQPRITFPSPFCVPLLNHHFLNL